jgi:hypothetical protein
LLFCEETCCCLNKKKKKGLPLLPRVADLFFCGVLFFTIEGRKGENCISKKINFFN